MLRFEHNFDFLPLTVVYPKSQHQSVGDPASGRQSSPVDEIVWNLGLENGSYVPSSWDLGCYVFCTGSMGAIISTNTGHTCHPAPTSTGAGGLEAKIQEAYSLEGGDEHIQYSVVGVYGVQTGGHRGSGRVQRCLRKEKKSVVRA